MKKLRNFQNVLMFSFLIYIASGFTPAHCQVNCSSHGTTTLPIGPTTWNTDRSVINNIIIPNGATLYINSGAVISFLNVMIIVQVGGELIISGGVTLQNQPNCPCYWGGILVEGNKNVCQTPLNANLQGYLYIKDATITGAKIAVEGRDGAILYCREVDFINNQFDVQMTPYSHNNGCDNGCDNISYFTLCNFIWNKPLCGKIDFETHVWLTGVYGIEFQGCQFRNDYPVVYGLANTRGTGIKAVDASFKVSHYAFGPTFGHATACNNSVWSDCYESGTRSLFCGLQVGINAIWNATGHINTCDPVKVEYAIFNDNNLSIITTDQSWLTVYWCNFYYSTTTAYFTTRPINFINCKVDAITFSIHYIFHNSFRTDEKMTQHLVLTNASNGNRFCIYKNQFRNAKVTPQEGIGIYMLKDQLTNNYVECNTFFDLNTDIYIDGGPGGDMAGGTVCHWPFQPQRCPLLPPNQTISAGNVFSNCAIPYSNVVNNSCNPVNYFVPIIPLCINPICGQITTPFVQPNLCEQPCLSCEYDFDYDADPPKCGGNEHRLTAESLNASPQSSISIYPNPANNHFNINFGKIELPCSISIYDMKGKLVNSFEATESITDVNTDNYIPGIYVVKIQNNSMGINEIQKIQIIK